MNSGSLYSDSCGLGTHSRVLHDVVRAAPAGVVHSLNFSVFISNLIEPKGILVPLFPRLRFRSTD